MLYLLAFHWQSIVKSFLSSTLCQGMAMKQTGECVKAVNFLTMINMYQHFLFKGANNQSNCVDL